ncbi:MAG TPA: glycoside hydrolase family 2 TIM barrel-domain containing protein [Opitutaceae bacterium]|jgi:hypothetical protein
MSASFLRFGLCSQLVGIVLAVASAALTSRGAEVKEAPLPSGVKAVWDLDQAYRETTSTRERICLNGLWLWQPAETRAAPPPDAQWGWFKVPGPWPGISNYAQRDCQSIFANPAWSVSSVACPNGAWYQREFKVPADWSGRRISIHAEYVNSYAAVFVNGARVGEIRFPGGDLDLTSVCRPGAAAKLSLHVIAVPLAGVMRSFSDTFGTTDVKGTVERRGLCGDVYLVGTPTGAIVEGVRVATSVRRWEITFDAALKNLEEHATYVLRAEVTEPGASPRSFTSGTFQASDVKEGRFAFTAAWKPSKLWDTCTPQNQCELRLSLVDSRGKVLDAALPERFGFREFWIDGRDFYLNGTRIFFCALPLDNAQLGAAWASYAGARETLERLKSFGVNLVYTHNYGCEPGTHLSFTEVLRAADDEGMLVAFSQPHFGQYNWDVPDADRTNGYAHDAAFYVRAAQNHPSVVFYSMSHNAVGTTAQIDPDTIGTAHDIRDSWSARNARKALRAAAIVARLDPSRIIYHHSGGNLGAVYTANFYANFTPIQEMSDWFGPWSEHGVKPAFLCEYGTPLSWDWTIYRGWYKGVRSYGDASAPWELCLAEWNAQFFGPEAYQLTNPEKKYLRWEAGRFRSGQPWHRWDSPLHDAATTKIELQQEVFARYLTDNIRAFRTWGLSGFTPWDHGMYWKLRNGVKHGRTNLKVDWAKLQRPGFSADYVDQETEVIDRSYERSDWIPTAAGRALIRNNLPLLAYIGGKPSDFTAKDHNFFPNESVEKQLIVINNSRRTIDCECRWSLALPVPVSGGTSLRIETGQQARVPLQFVLPPALAAGRYELRATVKFSGGESQTDTFAIDVLAPPVRAGEATSIALFDPQNETAPLLKSMGVHFTPVESDADLSNYDTLIVGKRALSVDGPAPDIMRVRDGLKVILFEQTSEALEQRFGFHVEEYGLRQVFKRVPDHPLLAGLDDENLHDWRGASTLLAERLSYTMGPRHAPQILWCGIPVTRAFRAGNRGNAASVLIEKPGRGDFLPILDGGFSLQYSPLLQYREGKGMVLFCQMDVTGRTEADPAGQILANNLLRYAAEFQPAPVRPIVYIGDSVGRDFLEHAGFDPGAWRGGALPADSVLVVGSGSGKIVADHAAALDDFLRAGGRTLALGLDQREADLLLPATIKMNDAEHVAAYFRPFGAESLLAGVSPAEVLNREPRVMSLIAAGASIYGDGVLALARGHIIFCQLTPTGVLRDPGSFDGELPDDVRKTYRRAGFLVSRLLANLGAQASSPLLERFHRPATLPQAEARWNDGLYLDQPEEWDDPYRFFGW